MVCKMTTLETLVIYFFFLLKWTMAWNTSNLFIWASQVVVGSFLPSNQQEQKPKKLKNESTAAIFTPATTMAVIPFSGAEDDEDWEEMDIKIQARQDQTLLLHHPSEKKLGGHAHAGL